MSIKTWKEEFYPKRASETTKTEAIDHSILKWIGLRPENLAKHEVGWNDDHGCLFDETGDRAFVDSSTCALCFHYRSEGGCGDCPLFQVRDFVQCDAPTANEKDAPYFMFTYLRDPEPMIADLLRAKRAIDEGVL